MATTVHSTGERAETIVLPEAQPTPGEREVSVLDILLVLARKRWTILWITLAVTVTGLILALLAKPQFTATTLILPPQQSGASGSGMMAELSSLGALGGIGGGFGVKNRGDMYIAFFKSNTVADGLIRQFDLGHEYHSKLPSFTRAALASHTTVKADGKTGLISISVEDPNPKRAAAMANGYVEQYRHLSAHLAVSEAAQRRLFFQQQMVQAKNQLADAEQALVTTEQKTGLVALGSQSQALVQSAAAIRAQITAKEVEIEGMQSYAAADNAGLIQAKKELGGLQRQLAKLGGNGDMNKQDLIMSRGKVPTASLEYVRRLRDVKYYETIFNILAKQFEAAKLDEAREGALVQVVDPAQTPDYKSSPKRSRWVIVSFAIGLTVSILLVLSQAAFRFLHEDPETDSKLTALRDTLLPRWLPRRRA